MKRTHTRAARRKRHAALSAEERQQVLARLSATVDKSVLRVARALADASGFRHSFSAYLNDVLDRDNKQRTQRLTQRGSFAQQTELPL